MGRSFYLSGFRDGDPRGGKDPWVDTEMQMREEGDRHPGSEDIPIEHVPIIDPRTGEQAISPLTGKPRTYPRRRNSSLGFDSVDVHYAGDRVVKLKEEVVIEGGKDTGRRNYIFQRFDNSGKSLGTYSLPIEVDGPTRQRITGKAKRYYSF